LLLQRPQVKIGSQVAKDLPAAVEAVRVIARGLALLAPDFRTKLQIVEDSGDDEGVLTRALDGAKSLFLVLPPSFTTYDDRNTTSSSPVPFAEP